MAQVSITAVLGPITKPIGQGRTVQLVECRGSVDGVPTITVVRYSDLQAISPASAQQTWIAQQLAARKPSVISGLTTPSGSPITV